MAQPPTSDIWRFPYVLFHRNHVNGSFYSIWIIQIIQITMENPNLTWFELMTMGISHFQWSYWFHLLLMNPGCPLKKKHGINASGVDDIFLGIPHSSHISWKIPWKMDDDWGHPHGLETSIDRQYTPGIIYILCIDIHYYSHTRPHPKSIHACKTRDHARTICDPWFTTWSTCFKTWTRLDLRYDHLGESGLTVYEMTWINIHGDVMG